MFKTMLAGTALATSLAFGAYAQTATEPAAPAPVAPMESTTPMAPVGDAPGLNGIEGLTAIDAGTVSADNLIGATITNPAGETLASVDDALMTPDGKLEGIVAKFGGFLGFGSNTVLLEPTELQFFHDAGGNLVVHTMLTPASLEGRPDYTPG